MQASQQRRKVVTTLLMETIQSWLDHAPIMPYLLLSFFNPLWAVQHHVSWAASEHGPAQSNKDTNTPVEAAVKEWYKSIIAHERTYVGEPDPD